MNVFYVLIRTTENYEFDNIRTAGVTGNAIDYTNRQGDNPIYSTRAEISQPSQPILPRAATASKFVRSRVNLQICKLSGLCSKVLLIALDEIPGIYSSGFYVMLTSDKSCWKIPQPGVEEPGNSLRNFQKHVQLLVQLNISAGCGHAW